MYPNLKLQMFKLGIRQNHIAKELGMADPTLSKIIHGYKVPSDREKKLLADYLSSNEEWLFEEYDSAPAGGISEAGIGRQERNGNR